MKTYAVYIGTNSLTLVSRPKYSNYRKWCISALYEINVLLSPGHLVVEINHQNAEKGIFHIELTRDTYHINRNILFS